MLTRPDYTASAKAVNDGDGGEGEYLYDANSSFANMIDDPVLPRHSLSWHFEVYHSINVCMRLSDFSFSL